MTRYVAEYTRVTPGHLIILIDQSSYMLENLSNCSYRKCDVVTELVNELLDTILRICIGGTSIYNKTFVTIVTYGDKPAQINFEGYIKELLSTFRGNWQFVGLAPKANGICNMGEAFALAYDCCKEWGTFAVGMEKENERYYPVPLIINITGGQCTDLCNVAEYSNLIKSIQFHDGAPLITNIIIDSDYNEMFFPLESHYKINDNLVSTLFNISSVLPETYKMNFVGEFDSNGVRRMFVITSANIQSALTYITNSIPLYPDAILI